MGVIFHPVQQPLPLQIGDDQPLARNIVSNEIDFLLAIDADQQPAVVRLDRDGKPDGTPVVTGRALDPLFAAVVEASEEAVLNSMFTAPTFVGRGGNTSATIHTPEILALIR